MRKIYKMKKTRNKLHALLEELGLLAFTLITAASLSIYCGSSGGGGDDGGGDNTSEPAIPLLAIARFHASSLAGAPQTDDDATYFQIAENTDLSSANANERSINAALTSETDITYSLTVRDANDTELSGADNPFELNTTGIVLFKADAAIDYEDRPTYKITVTLAKDGFVDAPLRFEVRLMDILGPSAAFAMMGDAYTNSLLTVAETRADESGPDDAIANGSPTYRWFRSTDAIADTSADTNTGQTGSGYRLLADDAGAYIFAQVSYTERTGTQRTVLTPASAQITAHTPLLATSAAETHTGTAANGYELSFENSNAAVNVIANGGAFLGFAAGDTLTNIQNLTGSAHTDSLTGDANANIIRGGGGVDQIMGSGGDDILFGEAGDDNMSGDEGNDVVSGGAGEDLYSGGTGNDICVLGARGSGTDTVTDFSFGSNSGHHSGTTGGNDRIGVDTSAGNEATLTALMSTADLRWTNNSDSGSGNGTNDSGVNDTIIYDTNGTMTEADDDILMILLDFNTALTIEMFHVF